MEMESFPWLAAPQGPPDIEEIRRSHAHIRPYIHRTPVLRSGGLDELCGGQLFFKAENFQRVGAFKMRGALRAAMSIPPQDRSRGLATHSSGNHAQAVALTAQLLSIPAYVVMPENAPVSKRNATEAYGARITPCASTIEARETGLKDVLAKTGAHFIPPFNDYRVIAGQATAALELLEDVPDLDAVLVPVGGGGLASGTALAAHGVRPGIRVFAAEPAAVDDAFRSLQNGRLEGNQSTATIADGLRTPLGPLTFDILHKELEAVLVVGENDIREALLLLWERLKVVVEPSAAVPFAAIRKYPERFQGLRTGIILSGGNVDFRELFGQLIR